MKKMTDIKSKDWESQRIAALPVEGSKMKIWLEVPGDIPAISIAEFAAQLGYELVVDPLRHESMMTIRMRRVCLNDEEKETTE